MSRVDQAFRKKGIRFDPPLYLQRQRWLLQQIQARQPSSVLEIGCGEGALIKALVQPKLWADASKEWKAWFVERTGMNDHPFVQGPTTWSPSWIAAVEQDSDVLRHLTDFLQDFVRREEGTSPVRRRYGNDTTIEIHQGDFSCLDEKRFANIDVIVASEVVEHLEDATLDNVGRVLLGALNPKCLLLTTPNYTFNEKFANKVDEETSFLDPTGRTQRHFRHDDHKFEWTEDEFAQWCHAIAQRYGYRATVGGVGQESQRPRKASGDAKHEQKVTFATQTVVFERDELLRFKYILAFFLDLTRDFTKTITRRLTQRRDQSDVPRSVVQEQFGETPDEVFHHTLRSYSLSPKQARRGNEDDECRRLVEDAAFNNRDTRLTESTTFYANVYDIWMDERVRMFCRGRLENLFPITGVSLSSSWRDLMLYEDDVFLCFEDAEEEAIPSDDDVE